MHTLLCVSTAGPSADRGCSPAHGADCQAPAARLGPYTVRTEPDARRTRPVAKMGAGAKAAANRQLIAAMRLRLAAGEQVARMYQEPGLAWLERQAEVAEELVAERKPRTENRPGS